MAVTVPNTTRQWILDGTLDLDADTVKVLLEETAGGASIDIDADSYLSDVAFDELDDASYARKTLSITSSVDDTDDEGVLDATDITWSALAGGENIEQAIFYRQGGVDDTTPGDDEVIGGMITTEMPLTTNGSDVQLQFAAEGFANLG